MLFHRFTDRINLMRHVLSENASTSTPISPLRTRPGTFVHPSSKYGNGGPLMSTKPSVQFGNSEPRNPFLTEGIVKQTWNTAPANMSFTADEPIRKLSSEPTNISDSNAAVSIPPMPQNTSSSGTLASVHGTSESTTSGRWR